MIENYSMQNLIGYQKRNKYRKTQRWIEPPVYSERVSDCI
jgi:hypothetical protein